MMRALLLLSLALLPMAGPTQGQDKWPYSLEDTLGKSEKQLLAMGRKAWFDFYTDQPGGSSTAGMCEAEQIFGTALKRRNDGLLGSASTQRKAKIGLVREHLTAYGVACTKLSANLSGGGTMWNVAYSGIAADTEELVGVVMGLPAKPAPHRTSREVTRRLATVESAIRSHRNSLDLFKESGFGSAAALGALADARKAYAGVLEIAKTLPRALSDALLDACLRRAVNIEFNFD